MYTHSKKESIQQAIIKMLESHNYIIEDSSIKKFKRMNKSQLNYFYDMVRYGWDNGFIKSMIKVTFGIVIIQE